MSFRWHEVMIDWFQKVTAVIMYWLPGAFTRNLMAQNDALVAREHIIMASCWLASAIVCSW